MAFYLKQDLNDTICALATAGGVGAIGVIRISGPHAIGIVNQVFRGKNLEAQDTHTIHFGKIVDGDRLVDEVLASVFIAPRSYTGEHAVELSCHGSPFIQQQLLELLVRSGCRMARPGEFTLRAFLNKKLDLAQAEAVADLIASNSDESHRTALKQMRGGFSNQLSAMREKLVNFASLIELELDFAEEDVEFAQREELTTFVKEILLLTGELLTSFKLGNAIRNGIPTVITGKPNAGKSTLLNALINEERAIVSDTAGTTRDTIEEAFVIEGIVFRLIDTAGIRAHAADEIESIGIERAYEKIRQASIVIYLFDATQTSPATLQQELQQFDGVPAIVIPVANKTDLLPAGTMPEFPNALYISSRNQEGIRELKEKLSQIVKRDEVKNDIIITNLRHYEALQHAQTALEAVLQGLQQRSSGELLAADIRRALFHLGEITGEVTTDDLLANIFSKFCIGK